MGRSMTDDSTRPIPSAAPGWFKAPNGKFTSDPTQALREPIPDGPPCVEFDGCCATHSRCFEPLGVTHLSEVASKIVKCEGWPCPLDPSQRS